MTKFKFDPMAALQGTVPTPQQQGRQASPLGGAARPLADICRSCHLNLNLSLNAIDGHTTSGREEQ